MSDLSRLAKLTLILICETLRRGRWWIPGVLAACAAGGGFLGALHPRYVSGVTLGLPSVAPDEFRRVSNSLMKPVPLELIHSEVRANDVDAARVLPFSIARMPIDMPVPRVSAFDPNGSGTIGTELFVSYIGGDRDAVARRAARIAIDLSDALLLGCVAEQGQALRGQIQQKRRQLQTSVSELQEEAVLIESRIVALRELETRYRDERGGESGHVGSSMSPGIDAAQPRISRKDIDSRENYYAGLVGGLIKAEQQQIDGRVAVKGYYRQIERLNLLEGDLSQIDKAVDGKISVSQMLERLEAAKAGREREGSASVISLSSLEIEALERKCLARAKVFFRSTKVEPKFATVSGGVTGLGLGLALCMFIVGVRVSRRVNRPLA